MPVAILLFYDYSHKIIDCLVIIRSQVWCPQLLLFPWVRNFTSITSATQLLNRNILSICIRAWLNSSLLGWCHHPQIKQQQKINWSPVHESTKHDTLRHSIIFVNNVANHRNELLCSRPTEFQTPELRATRSDGTGIPETSQQAKLRATIYFSIILH